MLNGIQFYDGTSSSVAVMMEDGVACLLLSYSGFVFRRCVPVASGGFLGAFAAF
jgi:hypothetical protein